MLCKNLDDGCTYNKHINQCLFECCGVFDPKNIPEY